MKHHVSFVQLADTFMTFFGIVSFIALLFECCIFSVRDTQEIGFFDPPIAWIALLCSVLLGFGDACFNTQIYSMLGGAFASNSVAAFAVFKFTQVSENCKCYLFSTERRLTDLQHFCWQFQCILISR